MYIFLFTRKCTVCYMGYQCKVFRLHPVRQHRQLSSKIVEWRRNINAKMACGADFISHQQKPKPLVLVF